MRLKSIPGKWSQLCELPFALWCPFIHGWLFRKKNEFVPCATPACSRLLLIPLDEFYTSYCFFCEELCGRCELGFFLSKLKPSETFYDIGGFRGAYSAAAKVKSGVDISVHIFEPLEKNAEAIERIRKLNAFDDFKINPLAVSDGDKVSASVNEQDAMLRLGDKNANATIDCPSISLDEYIARGNPPPTVVKLDVDGFELSVLRGARKCLAENHPRLWVEIHPQFLAAQGSSDETVLDLLRDAGYTTFFFDDFNSPDSRKSYHVWCQ